jgi:hypothetical protein
MNSIKEIEDLVKDINLNVDVFTKDESIFKVQVGSVETRLYFKSDILGSVDEVDPYLNNVLEPRSSCSGKNYEQGLATLQIQLDDKILNFTGYSVVDRLSFWDPLPRACYMLLLDLIKDDNNLFTRSFKLKLQKLWNISYLRSYNFTVGDIYPFRGSYIRQSLIDTEYVEIKKKYFKSVVDIQDFTRSWKKNLAINLCDFINKLGLDPNSIRLSEIVYGVKADGRIHGIVLNCENPIEYIKNLRSEILMDLRKKLINDQIDLILKELMIKVISINHRSDKISVIIIIALPNIDGLGHCQVKRSYLR